MPTVTKTIRVTHRIGGVLTDYTSLVLRDGAATYGLRRTDTAAIVVAAGTALNHDGTGLYSLPVAGLTPGVAYDYWLERVYAGATKRDQYNFIAPTAADDLPRYLTVDEAVAMAGSMPGVASFLAANSSQQSMALAMATQDLDNAQRYQGRKWDLVQVLQFPRVAYEASGRQPFYGSGVVGPIADNALPGADVVWDYDAVNKVAVVPQQVKLACVYQANSRLDPKRIAILDRIYSGLTSRQIGTGAEAYDVKAMLLASGGTLDLCRDAALLMRNYQLRQGRIL